MRKIVYIACLLLLPMAAGAREKAVSALERLEQQIADKQSYQDFYFVSCCDDSTLSLIDGLNMLASDADLKRLFRKGNGLQRAAAFVLIGSRRQDPKLCSKMLRQVIDDTTKYAFHWSDDVLSDMSVGGFCFSWARQQALISDKQFAADTARFDAYDTWPANGKECVPDEQGLFTCKWYGMFCQKMPEFPGGQSALFRFIRDNIRYPEDARKEGKQGRAICRFVVYKDGSLRDIEVLRSAGDERLDAEAVRLLQSMPLWNPASECGKPVPMKYAVPINFKLE